MQNEPDNDKLAQENAQGSPERLPDGPAGLGSSDGEVPPDAVRGPLSGPDEGDGQTQDADSVDVEDLP
ncbi:hypothetical protein GCM10022219_14210 [Microbacterium oryzae]|uniref:hypothetical protein n=1 Tax=Microbacterium oryzae TaxID=743009 RepID=UPI00156522D6|nr:hypothetical protein [Microbacterium oryzae]